MEILKLRCVGVVPLLMHNGRLADPLDEFSRRMKELTAKKKKTDADHEEIARIEWEGGLYWDKLLGPYIPGEVVEATLRNGARLEKRGKDIVRALQCAEPRIKVEYKGPREPDKMWDSGRFKDRRGCKNQGTSTVMRTRPRFEEWVVEPVVAYDETVLNRKDVLHIAENSGKYVGFCDYRPRYGRFDVEVLP